MAHALYRKYSQQLYAIEIVSSIESKQCNAVTTHTCPLNGKFGHKLEASKSGEGS
jgi:hypothetical protein